MSGFRRHKELSLGLFHIPEGGDRISNPLFHHVHPFSDGLTLLPRDDGQAIILRSATLVN